METLYTILDKKTGRELYATFNKGCILKGEIAVEELRTEEMENPHFDFETRNFYDKKQDYEKVASEQNDLD